MKRIINLIGFVLPLLFLLTGCFKDDTEELKENERRLLAQYIRENNITQEPTKSGLYYIPIEVGEGPGPVVNDVVEFEYTGKFLDESIFGTSYENVAIEENIYNESLIYGPTRVVIGAALPGLNEGFQLMKEGEKARLILPSDLAYGGKGWGKIAPYTTVIFDIHLQKVISNPEAYETNLILDFLQENEWAAQPDQFGIYYIEHEAGEGDLIKSGNLISMYYKGYFLDGRVFDSNIEDNKPYTFSIPDENNPEGLNEGLKKMRKGGKGTLIIPYEYGYGKYGRGIIPPSMTIVFDIEIVLVD